MHINFSIFKFIKSECFICCIVFRFYPYNVSNSGLNSTELFLCMLMLTVVFRSCRNRQCALCEAFTLLKILIFFQQIHVGLIKTSMFYIMHICEFLSLQQ